MPQSRVKAAVVQYIRPLSADQYFHLSSLDDEQGHTVP